MYDLFVYVRTEKILKSKSFFIEMNEQAVDIADCIAVEDTIENSKNSLWRFCNSVTLPRSEVVFFTQAAIIFIIVTSLLKIALDKPSCEDMSFWVGLLSAAVGYALPNPKLWTKSFSQTTDSSCQW